MSTSVIDIREKIRQKVADMQSINSVYDFRASLTTVSGEYPVAFIMIGSGEGEVRANVKSLTNYSYVVEVFTETNINFSASQSERITGEIIDEFLDAFRRDTTLSGTVTYCDQVDWNAGWEERAVEGRLVTLSVSCNKIETIA